MTDPYGAANKRRGEIAAQRRERSRKLYARGTSLETIADLVGVTVRRVRQYIGKFGSPRGRKCSS